MEGTSREEEVEILTITTFTVVIGLSIHRVTDNRNTEYRVNLNFHTTFSDGNCGEKQSESCRMSRKRPTQLDCLCELHARIQQDHDPKCVASYLISSRVDKTSCG
jgi:hypothetical protein